MVDVYKDIIDCYSIYKDDRKNNNPSYVSYGNGKILIYSSSSYPYMICGAKKEDIENKIETFFNNNANKIQTLNTAGSQKLKVFVYPSVVTPRDVIRTNYDIVRSKEKADIVVLPNEHDIIYSNRKSFYLVECSFKKDNRKGYVVVFVNHWLDKSETEKEFQKMRRDCDAEFKKNMVIRITNDYKDIDIEDITYQVYDEDTVHFLQKKNAYIIDLLNDVIDSNQCIINENNLPLDAPTQITPDSLNILWRCDDKEIFCKAIVSSNWKQYPFTASVFLHGMERKKHSSFFKNQKLRYVMNQCYEYYRRYKDVVVSPDDYNMCEKFMFKLLGIDGDRGFIKPWAWAELVKYFDRCPLKYCIAVRSRNITEPSEKRALI